MLIVLLRKEFIMKNTAILIITLIILQTGFTNSQWLVQNTGANLNINSVDFVDADIGWAAGDNSKVYHTTNGGTTWTVITVPGNPVNFTNLVSKEIDKMWPGAKNMIFGTTNGGANWFSTFLGTHVTLGAMDEQGGNLYAAAYELNAAEDTIISANVYRSTNNGVNWLQLTKVMMNANGDPVHGVDVKLGMKFMSNDTGYIATVRGVYKTVNGGLNFIFLQTSPPSPKVVVAGSNNLSGTNTFFVGVDKPNKLEIYKSTNGGNTWLLLSEIPDPNDTKIFSAISCPNNTDKVYLSISNRGPGMNSVQDTSIYYSSNSGANWYYQTLPVTNIKVNSINFADANTGFIAGSGGTILKTTNGGTIAGIQQTSNEIPGQYELHQNYPNPFNPVTNIKFDIISNGDVKLVVFDIQGREITTLVNQELQAGSYNTDWNAANYPSGVYFYSLEINEFIQTKKMILIK
jgi:photosystem II stability/assembly factor-like uncharacterized protein